MAQIKAIPPVESIESAAFWEECRNGHLALPRCKPCGHIFYYPRAACPRCGSTELESIRASGQGTVYSFSHVHVSFYGPDWEGQLPYTTVLVDLDEGPRMLSRLVGERREQVSIGNRVGVTFVDVENTRLPYFSVAEE